MTYVRKSVFDPSTNPRSVPNYDVLLKHGPCARKTHKSECMAQDLTKAFCLSAWFLSLHLFLDLSVASGSGFWGQATR